MRILVFRVHKINIGEGIVTKGAIGCVKRAFPDAEIFEISLYSDKISRRLQRDSLTNNARSLAGLSNKTNNGNHARVIDLLDADLAIIPGGILRPGMDQFMPTFRSLCEKNIPIVLLAAGGNGSVNYSEPRLRSSLLGFFEELNIRALITRDHLAYDAFSDDIEYVYSGIDCGFYINDWYTPPSATKTFATVTFDKSDAPKITTDEKQFYPHHTPFDNPHWSMYRQGFDRISSDYGRSDIREDILHQERTFISDNIREYLFLYANTSVTHSDRIHACIPTLAYNGAAQLYTDDLRRHIFDGLIDGDILSEPVEIIEKKIEEKKQEQVEELIKATKLVAETVKN